MLTIALAVLLPGIDAILIDEVNEPEINEIQSAVMRTLRLDIPFGAVLVLAGAWRIDLTSVSDNGIMPSLANAALQITATLFVTYLIWQIIRIWIDRAIVLEDADMVAPGHDIGEMEIARSLGRDRLDLGILWECHKEDSCYT